MNIIVVEMQWPRKGTNIQLLKTSYPLPARPLSESSNCGIVVTVFGQSIPPTFTVAHLTYQQYIQHLTFLVMMRFVICKVLNQALIFNI